MVEVRLRAVRVDLQSNTPVLLLQESEGLGRTLPIFIGAPEATAIAFALQGMDTPRPMTHDLIRDLLGALSADVVRVVVTELKSATYYAEIVLFQGDREDEDGDADDSDDGANPEELVGEFRTFLDSIRPEDFSS
jgi:bifunctional DNase/RNase